MTLRTATGQAPVPNLIAGEWLVISDGVMGGESLGRVEASPHGLRFSGRLSLENNGGFSSIRRTVPAPPAGAQAMCLRVRGDGRSYQARLRVDRDFDGTSWRHVFHTGSAWQDLVLSLEDFEPVFRGRRIPTAGRVTPGRISQIGFLVADGKAGDFRLDVDRLEWLIPVAGQ